MGPPFLRKAAVPTVAPQPPSPSTVGTASAGVVIKSRKPAPPGATAICDRGIPCLGNPTGGVSPKGSALISQLAFDRCDATG
jgi:hypothetical protein